MKTKITFTFDDENYDDKRESLRVLKANEAFNALFEIQQQVFRPARKHGYPQAQHHPLLDVEKWSDETYEVVGKLEELYLEVVGDLFDLIN